MKEWADLSKCEQDSIVELLAEVLLKEIRLHGDRLTIAATNG
jgi:hypothetical protein